MPSELHLKWARLLADALATTGMTQLDLAKAVGVRGATVSRWVAGIGAPRDERRAEVADAVGVEPIALFPFRVTD